VLKPEGTQGGENAGVIWDTGRVSVHAFSGEELQTRNAGRTALKLGGTGIMRAHGRVRQATCRCSPALTSRAVDDTTAEVKCVSRAGRTPGASGERESAS
jgi:hypothetical protein